MFLPGFGLVRTQLFCLYHAASQFPHCVLCPKYGLGRMWAGMCKPLQLWLSHARLCSSHTLLQALSRGSLLQQVPSEPQLHRCLSSATSSSCLPSVASHPAKLCPGLEMTKCPLVNCRTDRLELKVLIYMTMALTAQ